MPEKRRNVVDAEFIEADDLGSPVDFSLEPRRPPPRPSKEWGSVLLLVCIVAGVGYWIFSAWTNKPGQPEPWPPGFEDLIDCSYTSNLDGTKELNLLENNVAVMYDKSTKENGKYRRLKGKWAFDQTTKHYTVTLSDEAAVYSVLEPGGWGSCMFVKGDLRSVDLTTSWFAIPSDRGSDDPPEAEITAH
jgi:hypothetical protein